MNNTGKSTNNIRKLTKNSRKLMIASILIVGAVLLYSLGARVNGFANWYFEYPYRGITTVFAILGGWLPVSISEVLIYVCIVMLLVVAVMTARKVARKEVKLWTV